ncbi:conserved hypothetical protein [Desulfitobacterium hafniense DCB-2]|uniref:Thioredoxin n=1 Tax=Desulfitobacterium hafniense (strain DSM 10664 / DCB-2) TaxID=272564 RepID=B8FQH6_DESHD|nr:aryl-sulfate sulfotransferase [Desulfitobacterium hafniense]ACL19866.1 conserved hypothetical protein [Desulfitobacterium hafniense DCB-2]
MGYSFVHPTGVTLYNPEKAFNGYTLMSIRELGAGLIDMNGNVVRLWKDLHGFPNKLLPGGYVIGSLGIRDPAYGYQDQTDLVQVDWEGNVVWKFNRLEYIEDPDNKPQWMVRQHHDYQRDGNPVGYYIPGMECRTDGGNTLILCHENLFNTKISEKRLLDDCFIEVDWEGNILWSWRASDHFEEMNFSDAAKNAMYRNPNMLENGGGMGDWLHINSMSYLGPNQWYDAGDERFHPENIIWDGREANISAIIDKKSGVIVWQMGPDFSATKELRRIGQIIGQHHVHMIPKGLPGAGNILIFDNGSWGGYGTPSNVSKDGIKADHADRSRVIELNPVTMEVVWQLTASELGYKPAGIFDYRFYSPLTSSAQRLPNGNTLITEGTGFRVFEVTADHEVVWEFWSPFTNAVAPTVYRTYRYPYSYVPHLAKPQETPIPRLDIKTFRVPGAAAGQLANQIKVAGTTGYGDKQELCVSFGEEL